MLNNIVYIYTFLYIPSPNPNHDLLEGIRNTTVWLALNCENCLFSRYLREVLRLSATLVLIYVLFIPNYFLSKFPGLILPGNLPFRKAKCWGCISFDKVLGILVSFLIFLLKNCIFLYI